MSIKVMSYIWDKEFDNSIEKLILLCLADFANDEGICWPSIKTIQRKCDCSRSSVKRTLNKFETSLLKKCSQERENGSDGSNIYLFAEYVEDNDIKLENSPLYSQFSKASAGVLPEPGEGSPENPPIEPLIKNLKRNKKKKRLTASESSALDTWELFSTFPKFKEAWNAFIEKREDIKRPASSTAKVALLNKLKKLSPEGPHIAIEILNQSREKEWSGLFEVKSNNTNTKRNCDGPEETETDWDDVTDGIIYQDGKLVE